MMWLMCVYVKKTSVLLILDSRSIVKNKLTELNLVFICALIVPWLGLPNGWDRRGLQPVQSPTLVVVVTIALVPMVPVSNVVLQRGTGAADRWPQRSSVWHAGCRPLRPQPFGSPSQGTMSAQLNNKFNSLNLFVTILRESKPKSR